jgi:hypothetical protein
MALAEHDEVIGNLALQRSDETLDVAVLPGRPRRDAHLSDAAASTARSKAAP